MEENVKEPWGKRHVKESKRLLSAKQKRKSCRWRWRERDAGYLERAAQLKKTKRYCCLVTQGWAGGLSLFFSLCHTQIHTRGRGDASVGTKVLPLCKLKPLITSWESREKRGGRREMDGGQGERGVRESGIWRWWFRKKDWRTGGKLMGNWTESVEKRIRETGTWGERDAVAI